MTKRHHAELISEERIDEALIETFPASDPPAWTLGLEIIETSNKEISGIETITLKSYNDKNLHPS